MSLSFINVYDVCVGYEGTTGCNTVLTCENTSSPAYIQIVGLKKFSITVEEFVHTAVFLSTNSLFKVMSQNLNQI